MRLQEDAEDQTALDSKQGCVKLLCLMDETLLLRKVKSVKASF